MQGDDAAAPAEASGDDLLPPERPDVLVGLEERRRRQAIAARLFGGPAEVAFGRYRLLDRLGEGAMGSVYAAFDTHLERRVALKVIRRSLGDDDGVWQRTLAEARALARLSHPHVVHVYEVGELAGQHFVAMELLAGPTLRTWLKGQVRSWAETLRVFTEAGEGLAAAHACGLVHRDFKPQNAMLGGDGRVRVLDFGLARVAAAPDTGAAGDPRTSAATGTTRSEALVGTPAYMAPEQFRGEDATPRSDQFSFCVALYEALHGARPFAGETLAALAASVDAGLVGPRPLEPDVPPWVDAAVLRGLDRDPAGRWPSMSALLAALAGPSLADASAVGTPAPASADGPPGVDDEQALRSLALAVHPGDDPFELAGALADALAEIGARAERVADGGWVVSAPHLTSARDQAVLAARCARLIQRRWPAAAVALVTGRAARRDDRLVGEALDRGRRLLDELAAKRENAHSVDPLILADTASAALLEARFEMIARADLDDGVALGEERQGADGQRLLLGRPTTCVGRDRELATLEAVFAECREDLVARAVLVLAPPGLGKSRLRQEWMQRLSRRGEAVELLLGCGDPMKTRSAVGLLGEAIRQRLELVDGEALAEQRERLRGWVDGHLSGADTRRVAAFLGELCSVPLDADADAHLLAARQDPRIMSDQIEEAWLDLVAILARRRPLLVILEDLHWSDARTIRLVEAALRRRSDLPVMILALARPEVQGLYPDLWAGVVLPLPLHPLARRASARLVQEVLGAAAADDEVARLVERSTGNPFILEELIRASVERRIDAVPAAVVAMIQARIGALPPDVRRGLRAASVFGETFGEEGLCALLSAADHEVAAAIAEMIREEILERVPELHPAARHRYRFRHALVRDAVHELVSGEERSAWHTAAARYLAGADAREPFVVAEHLRLGGALDEAVAAYVQAAEHAHDAGDFDAALESVRRGLECGATAGDRGVLLSVRAVIALWREEFDQVLAAAPEALALLRPGSKPATRALYGLTMASLFARPEAHDASMTRFLAVEPEPEARSLHLQSAALLAITFVLLAHRETAARLRARVLALQGGVAAEDHNAWAHILMAEGLRLESEDARPHACMITFRRAAEAARRAGNRQIELATRGWACKQRISLGGASEALPELRRNLAAAEAGDDQLLIASARMLVARGLSRASDRGAWGEARALARSLRDTKTPIALGLAHEALARMALEEGDLEAAEGEARTALAFHQVFPSFRAEGVALLARALIGQGRAEEALALVEAEAAAEASLGIEPAGAIELGLALAEARALAGHAEAARDALAGALTILRRRLGDIPEPELELRGAYRREHHELLARARACGLEVAALEDS